MSSLGQRLSSHSESRYDPGVPPKPPRSNNKQLFRGFIGGSAFITKKGYRGLAIDSTWSKNIFYSFNEDDEEVAMHALKSSIADLKEVVTGGECGCPYSIGDYGFFTEEQFLAQASLISEVERERAVQRRLYFSETEWQALDDTFVEIAHYNGSHSDTLQAITTRRQQQQLLLQQQQHSASSSASFSSNKPPARERVAFRNVSRGDTFGNLAIRRKAFNVTSYFLAQGLDPLIVNEEGADMFVLIREQYALLTKELKENILQHAEYFQNTRSRTLLEEIRGEYVRIITSVTNFMNFLFILQTNYQERLLQIEHDKLYARRCELLHEILSPEKTWNIAQEEKIKAYLPQIDELFLYLKEKEKLAKHSLKEFTDRQSRRLHLRKMKSKSDLASVSGQSEEDKGEGEEDNDSMTSISALSTARKAELAHELEDLDFINGSNIERKKRNNKDKEYTAVIGTLIESDDTVIMYR